MSGRRRSFLEALELQPYALRKGRTASSSSRRASAPGAAAAAAEAARAGGEGAQPARAGAPVEVALMDWDTLKRTVAGCTRCGLHKTRTQTVFGVGNENADWMFIGEAPGADEDRQGEPFVGRAGQLLTSMIRALGYAREEVYIANILRCRPPNNREPAPEEAAQCTPYLERQIALVKPRIIVAVGRIAAQNLLQTDTPIGRMRGRLYHYGAARIPVVVTYHPAYLLRSPGEKRKAWTDLKYAREVFQRGHG